MSEQQINALVDLKDALAEAIKYAIIVYGDGHEQTLSLKASLARATTHLEAALA